MTFRSLVSRDDNALNFDSLKSNPRPGLTFFFVLPLIVTASTEGLREVKSASEIATSPTAAFLSKIVHFCLLKRKTRHQRRKAEFEPRQQTALTCATELPRWDRISWGGELCPARLGKWSPGHPCSTQPCLQQKGSRGIRQDVQMWPAVSIHLWDKLWTVSRLPSPHSGLEFYTDRQHCVPDADCEGRWKKVSFFSSRNQEKWKGPTWKSHQGNSRPKTGLAPKLSLKRGLHRTSQGCESREEDITGFGQPLLAAALCEQKLYPLERRKRYRLKTQKDAGEVIASRYQDTQD